MKRKCHFAPYLSALATLLIGATLIGHTGRALAVEAASADPSFDTRSLVKVESVDGMPKDVRTALGRQKAGIDGIADAWKKFNATDVIDSRLPMRRFIVGGASSASALVAYEQGGHSYSIHAVAFYLQDWGWTKVAEWTLNEKPRTFGGLLEIVDCERYSGCELRKKRERVQKTQPSRRGGPLRELNLSDNEVREIQSVALSIFPGSILNISGVVTGCPCEDGPSCSDQVWIVAHKPGETRGLELSLINEHWTVGIVQRWWLDLAKLESNRQSIAPAAFEQARQDMYDRFPACIAEPAGVPLKAAARP